MQELDDVLQHYGVKGMKWGVIRWRDPKKGGSALRERIGQEWDSMKRERQWASVVRNVDRMTTKEVSAVTKRIQLENELKRLSKSKIATAKDKTDYRLRGKMSDQELSRKVGRLRAKDLLQSQYDKATETQRKVGQRITQTASSLAIKYVMNKRKLSADDVWESLANPKSAQQNAIKSILETSFKEAAKKVKKKE